MHVLLFGANGQLGSQLRDRLGARHRLTALTRTEADLSVPAAIARWVIAERPEVVINAAAYTAVDGAESEPELVRTINAAAPAAMAHACAQIGALLIHYSTDYVFDGRADTPYDEDSPVNPQNVYGASKLAGERAVREAGGRHLVLRTSWVYNETGQNFLNTMLRLATERDLLRVVADQHGAPTYAGDLADATLALLAAWRRAPDASGFPFGLYHASAGGATTWHGFAKRIFALSGSHHLRIEPIAGAAYPGAAVRPAYSVLSSTRLAAAFAIQLPAWETGLQQCLARRSAGR